MPRKVRVLVAGAALAAAATTARASYIYNPTSLPGMGTCPQGSISWFTDSQLGQVVKVQVSEVDTSVSNSERCEFVGGGGGLQNGMTVYVGWRSRVQTPITSTWNGIYQAKCHGTHVADQPLVFSVKSGNLTLENHEDIGGQEVSHDVWRTTLPGSGTWFSIVMKIHYSESRTDGSVQLWYNGVLQTMLDGQTISHGQTWDGSDNVMHWGIYRRSSINGTEIHYVYKPRIATTFAEVDPTVGVVAPTPTPSPTPTPTATPTPTPTPTPVSTLVEVTPGASGVTASTNDGNLPGNAVDNLLSTRWSASGDGQWIRFNLGAARTVSRVKIAFYNGNTRQTRFDLQTSTDGATWAAARTGVVSSGTTTSEETFDFGARSAQYVRYLGHGNSLNLWNSLTEVSIFSAP
jgi:hypothetical protein